MRLTNTCDESGTVLGAGGCNELTSGNVPTSSSLGTGTGPALQHGRRDALPSKGMGAPLFDHQGAGNEVSIGTRGRRHALLTIMPIGPTVWRGHGQFRISELPLATVYHGRSSSSSKSSRFGCV